MQQIAHVTTVLEISTTFGTSTYDIILQSTLRVTRSHAH